MSTNYITEAFKKLSMLEEDVFNVDEKGLSAFKDFQDNDVEDNTVTIIDPNADTEDEIEGSYIGKVILDCRVCHSKIYKEDEEITIDEETESANANEECPFCYSMEGFTIIGEVAEYKGTSENTKQDETEEKDEEEIDEYGDENIEEMFRRVPNRRIKESPTYDLNPRYDKRKSFYGKAKVDTGYNDDENKLYSYGTLVAEIKDGKPVVYGTYSQTTLRHIKDWLKQNGFKAKSSRQIMADYGVKNESFRKPKKNSLTENARRIKSVRKNRLKKNTEPTFSLRDSIKDSIIEFPNGEYFYVDYANGKLFAGSYTNAGVIPEYEIEYDNSLDVDANLQNLYDYMVEQNPELLFENVNRKPLRRKSTKESFEGVTIDTGSQEISVTAKDKDEFGGEDETIIPLSDEKKRKIIGNTVEVDLEDIDEESFDELGESYFKKVYNNVKRYRTTEALLKNNALHISGDITFNSGKTKKTTFVLEAKDITRAGKARFVGENLQINKGKKAFNVIGTLRKNKFIPESMDYNYRVNGKNVRGNVKTKAKPIKRVTESRLPRSKRRI